MSSLLSSGGSRAYGFDLDIVKSSSSSGRSSHTSPPSSTLSESSNSSPTISITKARTPRKRPNQTYNEAAALLSAVCPSIFPAKSTRRPSKQTKPFGPFPETSSELLPPFPVLSDAAFLIREASPEKPAFRVEPELRSPIEKVCTSPASDELREAIAIPPYPSEEDFDAESILDEEVEEGIDSIMGNLSVNAAAAAANSDDKEASGDYDPLIDPYLRSLMVLGLGGKFELGLGFQFRRSVRRALRHSDDGDWWRPLTVPMQEIVPKFKTSPPSSVKKKKTTTTKKKVVKEEVGGTQIAAAAAKPGNLDKSGLGLKLNHEEVLQAWSDGGSVFTGGPASPFSSAEALAKVADVELFAEGGGGGGGGGGGVREASVQRYKEKRRTRLFSKKVRYQVRKVNADHRPRMKGRFVRSSSVLQQAIEEESRRDS